MQTLAGLPMFHGANALMSECFPFQACLLCPFFVCLRNKPQYCSTFYNSMWFLYIPFLSRWEICTTITTTHWILLPKTHSTAQSHPPHPPHVQPFPATPAHSIGTGTTHTSWKSRWVASQLNCLNLDTPGHILFLLPHLSTSKVAKLFSQHWWHSTSMVQFPAASQQLRDRPTSCTTNTSTTGFCLPKTYSAVQPHPLHHPTFGQPFPVTPEVFIGTGTSHTR